MDKKKIAKQVEQMKERMAKLKTEDTKILAKIPEPDRTKFQLRMDSLDKELEKILNKLEGR